MVWNESKDELPISGHIVLAMKKGCEKVEIVDSDEVRSHLSQYLYWQYKANSPI